MKKLTLALLVSVLGLAAQAQTLLYQWNFTNTITGGLTNMPPAYTTPALAGTGNLFINNNSGAGAGTNCYFTNGAGVGPVSGPGGSAAGSYTIDTQGYNGATPACTAIGTNLNLGTMYKFTICFWVQAGASVSAQFPRLVMVSASSTYDNGGANGAGSSLNGWGSGVAKQLQNAIGGTLGNDASGVTTANLTTNFYDSITGLSGVTTGNGQWYFEAIVYDATLASGNYQVWLGTSTTNVVLVQSRNLAYGGVAFGTNATIQIGNRNLNGTRGLSSGQIADVRIYAGTCKSNNLEAIRTLSTGFVDDGSGTASAPVIALQPSSGASYAGTKHIFTVSATGLTPLSYQWKSNNVPITAATNSTLTLTNIPLAANGASFLCSVTNAVGSTNSAAANLAVIAAAPGSYAAAVLTQNPYIYWHVNETTNGATNASTPVVIYDYINGLDGVVPYPANTVFNLGDLISPAFPGFTSTNTAIEVVNNSQGSLLNMTTLPNFTNGMTICGWIKTFGIPASHGIIYSMNSNNSGDGGGTTGDGYGLKFSGVGTDVNGNSGGLLSYNWNYTAIGSASYTPTLVVPTNVWTFIALTIDPAGTNATLFVGSPATGIQSSVDDTNVTGSLIVGTNNNAFRMVLGRSAYGFWESPGSYFGGNNIAFNDVTVFYTALSTNTLTSLYIAGAGVPHPMLTGVSDVNNPGYMLLTWNYGTLQEATVVTGPYTDVSGPPTSPVSVPMTDAQHFYRVRN